MSETSRMTHNLCYSQCKPHVLPKHSLAVTSLVGLLGKMWQRSGHLRVLELKFPPALVRWIWDLYARWMVNTEANIGHTGFNKVPGVAEGAKCEFPELSGLRQVC